VTGSILSLQKLRCVVKMETYQLEIKRNLSEMSCTPISSFSFTGKVTVNGQRAQQYTGQNLPIPAGFTNCISRSGNQLTITTTTPNGVFTNTVRDVNGQINGTLTFAGATVKLNGKGSFQ
jgi:hypothetical protein